MVPNVLSYSHRDGKPLKKEEEMIMKYWYAALREPADDWDNGSYDKDEAIRIAMEYKAAGYDDALVVVIDETGNVCVDVIRL